MRCSGVAGGPAYERYLQLAGLVACLLINRRIHAVPDSLERFLQAFDSKTVPSATHVELDSLSVRYGNGVMALDALSLEIGPGLFGLLGPNGAGKTTLMRTLATLQRPTAGRVRLLGHDVEDEPVAVRGLLGYLPQDFQTYPQLKVWEVLDFYGLLNGMAKVGARRERLEHLLERVGLKEVRSRRSGQLSGGMLRRLGVAQALLNDPRVLILDEPTAGLDPAERVSFRNFLGELSRDRVVILSTHIVPDIGSSCDRLAILERGRVRFAGRKEQLLAEAQGKVWRVRASDGQYDALRAAYPVAGMVEDGAGLELRLLAAQPGRGDWQPVAPTLEDAYLWLLQSGSDRSIAAPVHPPAGCSDALTSGSR